MGHNGSPQLQHVLYLATIHYVLLCKTIKPLCLVLFKIPTVIIEIYRIKSLRVKKYSQHIGECIQGY